LTLELEDKETLPFKALDISIHSEEVLDDAVENDDAEIFDQETIAELALRRVHSRVYDTRNIETVQHAPCLHVDEQHNGAMSKYESSFLQSSDSSDSNSEGESDFGDDVSFTNDLVDVAQRCLTHLAVDVRLDVQQTGEIYSHRPWLKSPATFTVC
jgi:hypothetical protein